MRTISCNGFIFFICVLFLSCASRASSAQESTPNSEAQGKKETQGALRAAQQEQRPEPAVVEAGNSPKPIVPEGRTPVVGGCNFDCIKPDIAAQNFFVALLSDPGIKSQEKPADKRNSKGPPAYYFVESRIFSYKGINHGEQWNRMWAAGDRSARKKKMEQFFADLRAELLGVTTGVAVDDLVKANLKSSASRPGEASYIFLAPGLAEPLHALFRKRGVEWLLHKLEVHQ